jgi:mutual gliding-motility protein MglA
VVVVSYSGKEINAKLVYYGAGLSGKTTNLEAIYEAVPDTSRGKMVSMKTQSDRTLFFDLLPLDLGEIMGFKTRFLLYTVPGQVFYNATRKLVLKGSDAIVFVADSEVGKMEENKESLANLKTNLAEYGLSLDEIPWVLQYNKRDLPNVYTVQELDAELNPGGRVPSFEAVATTGQGVFETFRGVSHLLMEKVTKDLRRTPFASTARTSAAPDHAARPEARPATPAPSSPQWTIASEARETVARSSEVVAGLEYGREISLPGETAPRLKAVAASVGVPTSPQKPAVESSPTVAPAAATTPAAAAAPAVCTATAPTANAAPACEANRSGTQELVVPVTLPRGAAQEIVLRIVLKLEG